MKSGAKSKTGPGEPDNAAAAEPGMGHNDRPPLHDIVAEIKNKHTFAAPLAYRVKDFCHSVGLGRTKFYELVRDGKIKTVVIGGRRLVPADEAQRLVRDGRK